MISGGKSIVILAFAALLPLCVFSQPKSEETGTDVPISPSEENSTVQPSQPAQPELKNQSGTEAEAPKTSIPEPAIIENSAPPQKDVISSLSELVALADNKIPALSKALPPQEEEKIINAVLNSMNSGMKYYSIHPPETEDNNTDSPEKEIRSLYPPLMIASNKIIYIRIDRPGEDTYKELKKESDYDSLVKNPPAGLIIDLRNASGTDIRAALKNLSLFLMENKEAPKSFRTHAAVLIGSKTTGSAEVLAAMLESACHAIVIGSPSAGSPFKMKLEKLSTGGYVEIPQIPDDLRDASPAPLKPAVTIEAYPQINYETLTSKSGVEFNDKCISRAADLLISLDAIRKKMNK